MQSRETIKIKEYDTLFIGCEYSDDDNMPLDLAGIDIKSDIRTMSDVLIAELNVEVLDPAAGQFVLTPSKDYIPVGHYKIDILFTKSGNRLSSETFNLNVINAVTEPR